MASLIQPMSLVSHCINRTLFCAIASLSHKRYKSVGVSYNHRSGDVALVEDATIGGLVDQALTLFGDRPSIVDRQQDIRKTYVQHVTEINQFAAGLLALNLNIGDRIGLWCPNRYEWTVAAFAAAKAGLILVPLNPAYQAPELEFCLQKLGIRAMVAHDQFKTQDYYKIINQIIPEISQTKPGMKVKSQKHPYFDTLIVMTDKELPGSVRYADVLSSPNRQHVGQLEAVQSKIEAKKPAFIMFTSGTTGKPKAAAMSHYSVVNSIYQRRKAFLQDPNEVFRVCCPPPLFHIFGYDTIIGGIGHGNTIVLPSMTVSAESSIKAIDQEKCHGLLGTATIFLDILNHPDSKSADFSSLKQILMGGSLCPAPLLKRIQERWQCKYISTAFGCTETYGSVTATRLDGPWEQVLESCGPPLENVEIKLVDLSGKVVPRGDRGEICARGYLVMLGYWGDEEKTREVLTSDGWYHTGDVGVMLEDGSLQVVDRIKDLIIRGGENIYPKEVEDLLMGHPKISEAHVFGVPDERLNEEVCVWIRCRTNETITESDVKEFCKGKISHFKIPRYIRFVENFPRTLSGKVQKYLMKEVEAQKMLAAQL